MIWKIWKKGKSNCEKIWKIQKKSKLNSEKIWELWKKVATAAAIHVYPRAAAAAAVAAAAAATVALKFYLKHKKRQNLTQSETHYENIRH
jgi:galactitol-specific phosphotransferase system IIC component